MSVAAYCVPIISCRMDEDEVASVHLNGLCSQTLDSP